jgi:hypothetical protein
VSALDIPMELPSASNLREHWAVRAKRVDSQRGKVTRRLPERETLPVLLVVRLTRVAPRRLDDDNLRGSLKAVRDAVATWLRVDDASPLVRWEYAQAKGEPGARIEVEGPNGNVALASALPPRSDEAEASRFASEVERTPRTRQPRAPQGYGANVTPNVRRGS